MKRSLQAQVNLLRTYRATPTTASTLGPTVAAIAKGLVAQRKKLGAVGEVWPQVVPKEIAEQVRPVGIVRGTLEVQTQTASVRYVLERWLKSGGEERLREALPNVKRVKIVV